MKKLFRYRFGTTEHLVPAASKEEAYENRAKVDPTFQWTPVEIEEVVVEGYEITITPVDEPKSRTIRPRKEV